MGKKVIILQTEGSYYLHLPSLKCGNRASLVQPVGAASIRGGDWTLVFMKTKTREYRKGSNKQN